MNLETLNLEIWKLRSSSTPSIHMQKILFEYLNHKRIYNLTLANFYLQFLP